MKNLQPVPIIFQFSVRDLNKVFTWSNAYNFKAFNLFCQYYFKTYWAQTYWRNLFIVKLL